MLHGRFVHHQRERGAALGVGDEQGPCLADAVAPLGDIVAVQSAAGLVGSILLHQLALSAHRLLAILPRVIEVRDVDADTEGSTHGTGRRSLPEVSHLLLLHRIGQPRQHHEEDDEQIVIGHLHVVGIHLEGRKDGRHDESPQIPAAVGQHQSGYHRRQIGQRHHLPDVASGNDDEEIAAEGPYHRAQCSQIPPEVERPQQDIETQQIDKQIPHILGQPQVIGLHQLAQSVGTLIRRSRLVGRHTAEGGVGPPRGLSRLLMIDRGLLSGTPSCTRVVPVENTAFDVRDDRKKQHCQNIGQVSFQCIHILYKRLYSECKNTNNYPLSVANRQLICIFAAKRA